MNKDLTSSNNDRVLNDNCFNIQASSYCLMNLDNGDNKSNDCLIKTNSHYSIPVFQRDYSWGEVEIQNFINDIFNCYWEKGIEGHIAIKSDPIFIGTMHFSFNNEERIDVIDGQQRISSILCLIKFLKLRYPENNIIKKVNIDDLLETRVNQNKEQEYLSDMLSLSNVEQIEKISDKETNRYLRNISLIKQYFEKNVKYDNDNDNDNEENNEKFFNENINSFIGFIFRKILFVVVKTKASLSETIKIFNTINTMGLDLNGNDIFKIRLYEYLKSKNNTELDDPFSAIGEIYKKVKDKNDKWHENHEYDLITMGDVRNVYKTYLIAYYNLPLSLHQMSSDLFFDKLFDVLLTNKKHKEMAGAQFSKIDLSIESLSRIVDVVYIWRATLDYFSKDNFICYTLIDYSRYHSFLNTLPFLILLGLNLKEEESDKQKREKIEAVYEVIRPMSRLLYCFSIIFKKQVNDIKKFVYNLYPQLLDYNNNKSSVINLIKRKINSQDENWLKTELGGQISYNYVRKVLICILSDYFEEIEKGISIDLLYNLYYKVDFDIEHINAKENKSVILDEDLQNSIGNLMLLESNINRSIQNLSFDEKKNRGNGKLCYASSNFACAKNIRQNNEWTKNEVEKRKSTEVERILQFIFER